ncbi:Fic family protein [Mycoplasma sp. Mirounga ES2805-ORL]|uniref:Fic family protein n=1 Tax=Mycoplasma sp. Mirounga ES2805-ORL TaxID=754514 RepID=UPI00197C7C51|nr:Fic family protein [Mycoplasma sp. Mirounga ES2805-ORL]QSF13756.1 Fic family protein [Mycoplasma sp. Mirounga ES2805-ORL]
MKNFEKIKDNKYDIIKFFFVYHCLPYNQIFYDDIIKKLNENKYNDDFFVDKNLLNINSQKEIKNFAKGLEIICISNDKFKLENLTPEILIRESILLNYILLNNVDKLKDNAGILRVKKSNKILVTDDIKNENKSQPPLLINYPGLLKDISNIMKISKNNMAKISLLSAYLLKNQLFYNGNKRMTFLLTNKLLINNGFAPYFDQMLFEQQSSVASNKRLLDEWNIISYINNIYKKYRGDKTIFDAKFKQDINEFIKNYKFINGNDFNQLASRKISEYEKIMEEIESINTNSGEHIISLSEVIESKEYKSLLSRK